MTREASARAVDALVQGLFRRFPDEAAQRLEELPSDECARLLETRPPREAAQVFEQLSPQAEESVLEHLGDEAARRLLAAIDPGRAAAVLARLEEERREALLGGFDPSAARELRTLAAYPDDTAGRLMDPRVLTFRADAGVRQVIARLRTLRTRRVHDVFLVDPEGHLRGSVPLQEIVLAPPETPVATLVRAPIPPVQALATREEVVERMTEGRLASQPVVDFEGRLLGVIRHDALIVAAEQEASVDIQTMVGASKEERALSPALFAVRKRLPWLQINLGTAFLAAAVVGLFEATIAQVTALAVLLPVVAGQSGNSGAQALAVTMRGLALREIRVRQWSSVLVKELGVGLVNGIAVAVVAGAGVVFWSGSLPLGLVTSAAMVVSMIMAGIAGAAIPTLLSALGQDPAQSSSIILTTVTDVTGFFSFLGLATLFASVL